MSHDRQQDYLLVITNAYTRKVEVLKQYLFFDGNSFKLQAMTTIVDCGVALKGMEQEDIEQFSFFFSYHRK